MMSRRTFNVMAASGAVSAMTSQFSRAEDVTKAKNVVLVHGLYADGSSWLDVIAHLQTAGLHATAVQNPLMSLEEDSAAVRRILAQQDGPTVLVGHSFAGTLISETGGDPIVSALVYVAARAPDAGEDFGALAAQVPKPPAGAGTANGDGYFWLNQEAFLRDFANGVDPARARALFAVQGPGADALATAKTSTAAWRVKPRFYQVSTEDRTINPELERFLPKRMKATTIDLSSG